MTEPEVSILIPTRNRQQTLLKTVASALAQRGVDIEVVVTDDGSTDGTWAALEALPDARLTLVRHEASRGVARARNSALAAARGRWVAFLDDDDLWSPDKVRLQLEAITESPGTRWSCCGAVWLHDGQVGRPEHPPAAGDQSTVLLQRNVVPGGASSVLAEKSLVEEVGTFDPAFSTLADWDLWVRLALASPVACVDRPLVGYVIHTASMSHDIARTEEEYGRFEQKYAGERRRRDVALDRSELLWYFGAWSLRKGDRYTAARLHAQLALSGTDRPLRAAGAAVVSLVWPGVQHRRDRWSARRMSPSWRAEVGTWLAGDGRAESDRTV